MAGLGAAAPRSLCQAGIAEETLFRGYLFGHLSRDRSFWRAAALATAPFVAVHLTLFAVLAWPVALASVMLSAALSFPLSYLVLVGGRTIWAPALLHCVIQGALKVVVIPESDAIFLPLVWILASAIIPYSVFLVRLRPAAPRPVSAGDAQALP
jgi:membrane protease YdiL (CAAX protease family)